MAGWEGLRDSRLLCRRINMYIYEMHSIHIGHYSVTDIK